MVVHLPSIGTYRTCTSTDNSATTESTDAISTNVQSLSARELTPSQVAARHVTLRNLPEFRGNPAEWEIFLSAYTVSTESCGSSHKEHLPRLKRAIQGPERDMLRSQPNTAKSVPKVMETLEMLYGRLELIVNRLLKKIEKQPVPKANDSNHLKNPLFIKTIVNKLSPNIKLNWAYFRESQNDLATLGDCLYRLAKVTCQIADDPLESHEYTDDTSDR